MYESVLPRVLAAYGIKYQHIFDFQKGYRNEIWPVLLHDGRMINVTFYKQEPAIVDRIKHSNDVSEFLAASGLPTRKRFDKRILALNYGTATTKVGVYDYLPGNTIPWEAYTMVHIKLLGMIMSNMHSLLRGMGTSNFYSVYDEYGRIIDDMEAYFTNTSVSDAIWRKLNLKLNIDRLEDYRQSLQRSSALENQQVLHMDFVRGNILFDKAGPEYDHSFKDIAISGILDFEKTSVGHPLVEISRTLAFLLVDCKYKSNERVEKYFLYSGYLKRGQSKDIGDDRLRNQLVDMFLLYDLYKFLRHNPYESLHYNEHYKRTRDILVKRGVVF